jgi:hypothetical protein
VARPTSLEIADSSQKVQSILTLSGCNCDTNSICQDATATQTVFVRMQLRHKQYLNSEQNGVYRDVRLRGGISNLRHQVGSDQAVKELSTFSERHQRRDGSPVLQATCGARLIVAGLHVSMLPLGSGTFLGKDGSFPYWCIEGKDTCRASSRRGISRIPWPS